LSTVIKSGDSVYSRKCYSAALEVTAEYSFVRWPLLTVQTTTTGCRFFAAVSFMLLHVSSS